MDATSARGLLGLDERFDLRMLRRAHRRRLLTAHPDRGGSLDAMEQLRSAFDLLAPLCSPTVPRREESHPLRPAGAAHRSYGAVVGLETSELAVPSRRPRLATSFAAAMRSAHRRAADVVFLDDGTARR